MLRRPPLHYPERPLHHFLQDAADRHPERIALRFGDDVYTYRELDSTGNSLANALTALGVGAGSRVALAITNRPEWVIAQHAVSLAGGAVVLPNPLGRRRSSSTRSASPIPTSSSPTPRSWRRARRRRCARDAHLCRRAPRRQVAVVLGSRLRHPGNVPGAAAGRCPRPRCRVPVQLGHHRAAQGGAPHSPLDGRRCRGLDHGVCLTADDHFQVVILLVHIFGLLNIVTAVAAWARLTVVPALRPRRVLSAIERTG